MTHETFIFVVSGIEKIKRAVEKSSERKQLRRAFKRAGRDDKHRAFLSL